MINLLEETVRDIMTNGGSFNYLGHQTSEYRQEQ